MPLSEGTSKAAREKNIATEIEAGKKPEQAVAIAYAQQRKNAAHKGADNAGLIEALEKLLAFTQR